MLSQGAHTQPGTNRRVPTFLTMMVYLAVHREAVFSCLAGVPIFFLKKGKQSNNMKNCGLELPDFTTRSKFFQNKIPQIFQWQQGVCLYTAVAGWGVVFFVVTFS